MGGNIGEQVLELGQGRLVRYALPEHHQDGIIAGDGPDHGRQVAAVDPGGDDGGIAGRHLDDAQGAGEGEPVDPGFDMPVPDPDGRTGRLVADIAVRIRLFDDLERPEIPGEGRLRGRAPALSQRGDQLLLADDPVPADDLQDGLLPRVLLFHIYSCCCQYTHNYL